MKNSRVPVAGERRDFASPPKGAARRSGAGCFPIQNSGSSNARGNGVQSEHFFFFLKVGAGGTRIKIEERDCKIFQRGFRLARVGNS